MNLQKLQLENQELKRKLQIAQMWMEREVRFQVEKISLLHVENYSDNDKTNLKVYSDEDIIKQITEFI